MKLTFNWLKQYVDFEWSPEELAERLTMLGLEVEGRHKVAGEFEGVVVAQVITREKHPNADKLSLCRVNDGRGERAIVCGAQNFKAGDKVPLILPGASLPPKAGEKEPFTIKVGKIRGVESHGMMCSPKELGLSDEAEGLLILRQDARIGLPFAEYLGRASGDVIYDLEVTPNRPDWNSVIGIAREIAAVTGHPLKRPEVSVVSGPLSRVGAEAGGGIDQRLAVRVEEPELCPRYVARIVLGVKIGPSPEWLRSTLEKIGLRSINNVVDVTNYVMLETGQPLHAFDYHLLAGPPSVEPLNRSNVAAAAASTLQPFNGSTPTVVIRRARQGEKFTTLDGVERALTNEMLLIADEQKAIALAGVMGGRNTEINEQTKEVLIESAYFKPANIRRTSKALGLRSESSYRFERGADIGITDWASARCAQLILQTAGGQLVPGAVDASAQEIKPSLVTLRHSKTDELLGISIPAERQVQLLASLGLEPFASSPSEERESDAKAPGGTGSAGASPKQDQVLPLPEGEGRVEGEQHRRWQTSFHIPTFRVDLKRETDLIEEIARLHGVDKITASSPRGAIGSNAFDSLQDQISEVRRILAGLGLNEAQGQTLIGRGPAELALEGRSGIKPVLLANPLSSDMNVLRPSLLPGLLDALRHNVSRRNHEVALFEIGRVFILAEGKPREERRLALALTGQRQPNFWTGAERDAKCDAYDLKGLVEQCLELFGLRALSFAKRPDSTPLFLESAAILLGGKLVLGEMGQLLTTLAKQYDLRDPVYLAEFSLDQLLARRHMAKSFQSLPQFPAIRRDVAMLVAESVTHEAVLNAVKQARPANLETVELFDVFRGQNVPDGQKSVAYTFIYRHREHTLTDAEVNAAHEKLVAEFKEKLQATVR